MPYIYPMGGKGGSASPEQITTTVEAYLAENFTNPSNPPLDRTLTSSSSAAPADIVGDLKSAIAQDAIDNLLQVENIFGTTQSIVFDAAGNVQGITHKDGSNNTVRTDVFTFAANSITETRALSTGESLTIVTNLTTLETTTTYAAV